MQVGNIWARKSKLVYSGILDKLDPGKTMLNIFPTLPSVLILNTHPECLGSLREVWECACK